MLSDKKQRAVELKRACSIRYYYEHKEALNEKRKLMRAGRTPEEKKQDSEYSKNYYKENKLRLNLASREDNLKNKEKRKVYNKAYREKNKERILADKAEKRRDPVAHEMERATNRAYAKKNNVLLKNKRREKYKENPEPFKVHQKKYFDKFKANEPDAYNEYLKSKGEPLNTSHDRRNHRRLWEDKEDLLVYNKGDKIHGFNLSDAEISLILHRTRTAVTLRRWRLVKSLKTSDNEDEQEGLSQ